MVPTVMSVVLEMRMLGPRVSPVRTYSVAPMPKTADPFYLSADWRKLVEDRIKQRGSRCEDPAHDPTKPRQCRVVGDHIREIRDGGARLDPANVMLRCWPCHTRKTAGARAARAREG